MKLFFLLLGLAALLDYVYGVHGYPKAHAAGFKDLFKRKPGGTTIGNVLRTIGSKVTHMDLSNLGKIPLGADPAEYKGFKGLIKTFKGQLQSGGNGAAYSADSSTSDFNSRSADVDDSNEQYDQKGLFKYKNKTIQWLFPKGEKWYKMPGAWIAIVATVGIVLLIWRPWKKKRGGRRY